MARHYQRGCGRRGVDQLDICGIATDYCVHATALDAVREGFDTTVLLDLTAAVAPDRVPEISAELKLANGRSRRGTQLGVEFGLIAATLAAAVEQLPPAKIRNERIRVLEHPAYGATVVNASRQIALSSASSVLAS